MTNTIASQSFLTPLISSAAMRAVLDDRARLQRMLNFEVALARAEAAVGVVPASITERIAEAGRAERYDPAALATQAVTAGNIAIPLVKALTAEVAKADAEAARYVHWGASSYDVIDTALVLDLRDAIDALVADLTRAIDGFSALAGRHRRNAAVARTSLQHALPMPFGLKLSGYAAALARSRERLRRLRREALALQFGGTGGTLAELGERGLVVAERLAALLDLPLPDAPWHGHSDRLAEVASAIAILTGTCGKIARDVTLLMQTEIAEVSEQGGEAREEPSSLARKSEPSASAIALSAATIVPNLLATIVAGQVQEHERGASGWQAQCQTFPTLLFVASGALGAIADISQGLDIDAERMRTNLEATNGLILADAVTMTLAQKIGKSEAQRLVQEACRKTINEKRHLHDILREDLRVGAQITVGELARLFELMGYQGAAQTFIDRQIGSLQGRAPKRP
jgi:3-carboxy-cis,cis-muconate cycloisomerase